MNLLSRGLFATCVVVVVAATAVHAAYILPDHRAYRDIDALRVRGHMVVPAATIRPYTRRAVAVGAHRLLGNGDLSGYEREIAERLMAMFAKDLPGLPDDMAQEIRAELPDIKESAKILSRKVMDEVRERL